MIKHIVWWTLKDTAENASALENALKIKEVGEALMGKIEELKAIEISVDIKSTTTLPVQLILQSTHDSEEGLAAYANHPEHLKLGEFIKKVASSRSAIDYSI